MTVTFDSIGRLPAPGDNVAIASRRLDPGTEVKYAGQTLRLSHTILEGHRFAIVPIRRNMFLNSWNLPFGMALRDIAPGDYVCNEKILQALRQRHVDFPLPDHPNFENYLVPYSLDQHSFTPGIQVPRHQSNRTFLGYDRGTRGVGTRNYIVVLGTSSLTSSFARTVAERFQDAPHDFPNIDGVVAVAHTEGGGAARPNNFEIVMRALAGFIVHPNVAAVLAVDDGAEPISNRHLQQFLAEKQYPVGQLPHRFISTRGRRTAALAESEASIRSWLELANGCRRTPQSLEHLRIALQCGGSDAFSGVSGNPLAGWVAKETIRQGGAANLAETDELMGAEAYVLQNVRNLETAQRFLQLLDRFRERAQWHGHNAEGNPSGGNNYRGLYNIAVKSIGAAKKKDPDVRLDYVIEYGERMAAPGFYFMDSPGNDLESIAGQVASGCNLILFTTGNGSITNFPFVPTIKIMTSTARYNLLPREMDVNAGRYQDGIPMDELGAETFELALRIVSGERSAGEKAKHSQVQLWREWRQTNERQLDAIFKRPRPTGVPLKRRPPAAADVMGPKIPSEGPPVSIASSSAPVTFEAFETETGVTSDQLALIVPTSLCSGQIGRLIADSLNRERAEKSIRVMALPHTEGCGVSGGECEELLLQTLCGYLRHPFVRSALLLEHGCEKTHNQALRNFLEERGIEPARYGWASVQLDGGIEKVTARVKQWFAEDLARRGPIRRREAGLDAVRIGIMSDRPVPETIAAGLGSLAGRIVDSGGTVVVPQNSALLRQAEFRGGVVGDAAVVATIGYGEPAVQSGFHVMDCPTDHHVEILTGLGATGVEILVAHVSDEALQGHPMIPMLQMAANDLLDMPASNSGELDLVINGMSTPEITATTILNLLLRTLSGEYRPRALELGNTDFQMTRGFTGFSL